MAYNKARAEKEWLEWKNDEETKLRKLGVDEDTIQRLHAYDWEAFKADRRYRERNDESEQPIDAPAEEPVRAVQSVSELMESIENERLYAVLEKADKETLQILIHKMNGYTTAEIIQKTGIAEDALYKRISRLRKKIKNIF